MTLSFINRIYSVFMYFRCVFLVIQQNFLFISKRYRGFGETTSSGAEKQKEKHTKLQN